MAAFTRTLELGEDAWDVYLLYGPEARWVGDVPPKPVYWMHQLGSPTGSSIPGPFLDTSAFAAHANALLAAH